MLLVWLGRPLVLDLFAFVRRCPWFTVMLIVCVGWLSLLWAAAEQRDATQLSRLLHFVGLSLFGALGLARSWVRSSALSGRDFVCRPPAEWLRAISYVSPDFRSLVAGLLVAGGNIDPLSPVQVAGFSNSSGAALSVVQALGRTARPAWPMSHRRPRLGWAGSRWPA